MPLQAVAGTVIRSGVALASDQIVKHSPELVAKAKQYVGKALGIPAQQVNLGAVAKTGDQQASIVATALVRAGATPDAIITAFDMRAVNDKDVREFIEYIRGVHSAAMGEVDKNSGHAYDVDAGAARKVKVLVTDVDWLMGVFGIREVSTLVRAKAIWENLNSNTFQVYAESVVNGSGN